MQYWNDLKPGQCYQTSSTTLTYSDITGFAEEFDPQPYHLDAEQAKNSIFGGLCASGWQMCAVISRLVGAALQQRDIAYIGLQSVSTLRWKKPVFVDETLSGEIVIRTCERESEQPGLGLIECDITMNNADNQTVVALTGKLLIAHAETAAYQL